ncbi:MAG: HYR domain-containing protein [Lewinellaceae bacterium]|nr:HYR domain-containing protein [Lewinellaceae bacterium]
MYAWSGGLPATEGPHNVSPGATTTYTVTITDANGCTATAEQTITIEPAPVCSITLFGNTACANSAGNYYEAPAGMDSYAWSIQGAGTITTPTDGQSIEVTAGASGTYTVTVEIEENGCTSTCSETINIQLLELTLTAAGPANATCGDIVQITIAVSNSFTDLSSLQYSVEWDETELQYISHTALEIGGVGGDPIIGDLDALTLGELTYSWFDPSGFDGEDLADATVILTLNMKVLTSSGSVSVDVSNSPLVSEVVSASFCINTANFANNVNIALNPITVTCPSDFSVCVDQPVFLLTDGTPAGGTHSGMGVAANMFNPATAGVGPHVITYTYTDGNGCTNSCTYTITVNALPVMDCPDDFAVCVDATPFALSGATPIGGTYSGTGVTAGTFDPSAAGVGPHVITYSYTDGNGCTNSCTYTITVNALPVMDCPDDFAVCVDATPFALSGAATPLGGTLLSGLV